MRNAPLKGMIDSLQSKLQFFLAFYSVTKARGVNFDHSEKRCEVENIIGMYIIISSEIHVVYKQGATAHFLESDFVRC